MYKVVPDYQLTIDETPPVMKDNTVALTPDRSKQLFDYINAGLSSQEDDGIWTNGTVIKIPMLLSSTADKNILQLTPSAFGNQTVVISLNGQKIGTNNCPSNQYG